MEQSDLTDVEFELLRQTVLGKRLASGNHLRDYRYYTFNRYSTEKTEVDQALVVHLIERGYLMNEPLTYPSSNSEYEWIILTPLGRREVFRLTALRGNTKK